jgi:dolichol-phosphate mannosyltransferase
MTTQETTLSVVIPVFNEATSLEKTFAILEQTLDDLNCSYEIIFVNDGSTDSTEDILTTKAGACEHVKAIHLSRNFGKEAALAAGLDLAVGECIVFVDADLQHPPNLIPRMFERWKQGLDIVNARKVKRGTESLTYRLSAHFFNWFMSKALGSDFSGATDYKLIDRQVADILKCFPERNRFFRGLVTWVGYRCDHINFEVQEREDGSTKWSSRKLLRYSANNLLAFSSLPLEMVAYVGFAIVGLGVILMLQTLYMYFFGNAAVGFTTVIVVQILLGGMVLASLGVIALYIAKIYQEQKARPIFVIRKPTSRPDDM